MLCVCIPHGNLHIFVHSQNQTFYFYWQVDLTRSGPIGRTGGGVLNDLYTMYVQHVLLSEECDGIITVSPPALSLRQPGLPGSV